MEQKNGSLQKRGEKRKNQFWIWILFIVLILIFVAAVVIFLGGWWAYKNKVQQGVDIIDDQGEFFESENWLNNLDNYYLNEQELEDIIGEPNMINGTEIFVSNEYGFTLKFTKNWPDYKAMLMVAEDMIEPDLDANESIDEAEIEQMRQGYQAEYIFYYPSGQEGLSSDINGYEDLFSLNIYAIDDYDAIKSGRVQELARNNKYIFTYTNYYIPHQDTDVLPPRDIPQAVLDDIESIARGIETFDVRVSE